MKEQVLDYSSPKEQGPRSWEVGSWVALLVVVGILMLLVASFLVPMLNSNTGGRAPRVRCASNLRQIGQGIMLYANDHQGRWPDSLDALIVKADINPEWFVCPSSSDSPAPGATPQEQARNLYNGGHLSFVYLGKGLREPVHADRVVAYELPGHHEGAGMNVMFGDGHVEWFAEPKAKQILADLAAGWNPPKMLVTASQRAGTSQPAR